MAKTEVYTWRLDPDFKMDLEAEVRRDGTTLAEVLDRLTKRWLQRRKRRNGDDEAEQARLHAAVMKYAGAISGGDPYASEKVREVVRRRVRERNAH
jgi:hypothetical protein